MRNYLILALMFLMTFLASCEKEEVECKCDLKVTIDGDGYYWVNGIPTDCNGNYEVPSGVPPEHFIIGLENCR